MNAYKRVLVKLSGEALKGNSSSILSAPCIEESVAAIKGLVDRGVEVSVVCGAGNIWRGKLAETIGIEPAKADYMGMLGTVINALALEAALNNHGVKAIAMSALEMNKVCKSFTQAEANKALKEGYVVIFGGGTGNPFFTTDTCAALRAVETHCDAILMAKNGVDGVYSKDPNVYKDAEFFKQLTYKEFLDKNLGVMDSTAVSLLVDKNIELRVFCMQDPTNFGKIMDGIDVGTKIIKGE